MKLVTFLYQGREIPGILEHDTVRPLPCASMQALIESGTVPEPAGEWLPLSMVTLLAPIPHPRQDIICLGINYRDHAEEAARFSGDAFRKPCRLTAGLTATLALWSNWITRRSWRL